MLLLVGFSHDADLASRVYGLVCHAVRYAGSKVGCRSCLFANVKRCAVPTARRTARSVPALPSYFRFNVSSSHRCSYRLLHPPRVSGLSTNSRSSSVTRLAGHAVAATPGTVSRWLRVWDDVVDDVSGAFARRLAFLLLPAMRRILAAHVGERGRVFSSATAAQAWQYAYDPWPVFTPTRVRAVSKTPSCGC